MEYFEKIWSFEISFMLEHPTHFILKKLPISDVPLGEVNVAVYTGKVYYPKPRVTVYMECE